MQPHVIAGIKLGSASAGIRQTERNDLVVVELAPGTTTAVVLTRNAFQAAPIKITRQHLSESPRYLVINSGNANAGTGEQGLKNALQICQSVAQHSNSATDQVLPFSTGVIGEQLPVELIEQAIPQALQNLTEDGWSQAASAIMTTDTRSKTATTSFIIGEKQFYVTGISKGSGMIHPNMATMLAFVATDVSVSQAILQTCLNEVISDTFNSITVDGDTSTNDACVLMATGKAEEADIQPGNPAYHALVSAVKTVCSSLAEQIVRDGEGATKFIRIQIENAQDRTEAELVGKTIAGSSLVKTAFFASDPNWGRILAAIGRAPVENLDVKRISLWLNDVNLLLNGNPAETYREEEGQQAMTATEITVRVSLDRGSASATILSCDLSYDYVRINAEYRT
ncbi:MAG: bifunctional glutamate N-acetyltransferase/amino-acid acetyltransferase ArgJ [Methylococcales bacterium]